MTDLQALRYLGTATTLIASVLFAISLGRYLLAARLAKGADLKVVYTAAWIHGTLFLYNVAALGFRISGAIYHQPFSMRDLTAPILSMISIVAWREASDTERHWRPRE